jgi:hypothetical protein
VPRLARLSRLDGFGGIAALGLTQAGSRHGKRRLPPEFRRRFGPSSVYKVGFWLLEAKEGQCADPSQPPTISNEMIEQAYFYAHHREIDCSIFGVSNGWWTNLYDRDAEDPMRAIVSIFHRDLPDKVSELYSKIGATQVTFELKRRILRRMEQVLAVSRITLPDWPVIAEFDGLHSSASRVL